MSFPEPRFVVWDELRVKTFAKLGIRHTVIKIHQTQALSLRQAAKFQVSADAWNMDYPDGAAQRDSALICCWVFFLRSPRQY